jgi:CshA-type fibril repeat protein
VTFMSMSRKKWFNLSKGELTRRRVLTSMVLAVGLLALLQGKGSATNTSVTETLAIGQSGYLALPATIGSASVDSSYTCFYLQGNCVTTGVIANQGTFTVNLDGSILFEPAPAFTGATQTMTYSISSAGGAASTTGTFTFHVASLPTLAPIVGSGPYDTPVIMPVSGSPGQGTTLDWMSGCLAEDLSQSSGCTTDLTVTSVGRFHYSATAHAVTFTPDSTFSGAPAQPPLLFVSDALGQQTSQAVVPTTNRPPILAAGAKVDSYGKEGALQVMTPSSRTGTGGVLDATQTCIREALADPCDTQIPFAGVGTFSVTTAGLISFQPAPDWVGDTEALYVRICDVFSDCVDSQAQAHVIAAPPAPALNSSTNINTPTAMNPPAAPSGESSLIASSIRLVDQASRLLTTSSETSDGSWTVDSVTGSIHFTPRNGFVGIASIPYVVTDQVGNTSRGTATVVVSAAPPEQPPTPVTAPAGAPSTSQTAPATTPTTPTTPTTQPSPWTLSPPLSALGPVGQSSPSFWSDWGGLFSVGIAFCGLVLLGLLLWRYFGIEAGDWWIIGRRRRDEEEEGESETY